MNNDLLMQMTSPKLHTAPLICKVTSNLNYLTDVVEKLISPKWKNKTERGNITVLG